MAWPPSGAYDDPNSGSPTDMPPAKQYSEKKQPSAFDAAEKPHRDHHGEPPQLQWPSTPHPSCKGAQERSQEDRVDNLHSDMTSTHNQTAGDESYANEQQNAHIKELIEVENDRRLREVDDVRTELLDTAAELRHECNSHSATSRRMSAVEETDTQAAQVGPVLAQLTAQIEATDSDSEACIENSIQKEEQTCQLREEHVDAQKDMQYSSTQQVELATTTLLPVDDVTPLQNQAFTLLCADLETANKQACFTAENTPFDGPNIDSPTDLPPAKQNSDKEQPSAFDAAEMDHSTSHEPISM